MVIKLLDKKISQLVKTEYSTTVSYLRVVRLCPDRVQQLIEVGNVLTCESEFSCLVVHQRCSSTGTSHVQLLDESVVGSRIRFHPMTLLPSRWRSCVDAAPRLEQD